MERLLPSHQPRGRRAARPGLRPRQPAGERPQRGAHAEAGVPTPAATFFAFYVGRGDARFRAENERLHRELSAAHVPHVFELYPGAHEQSLWQGHARQWLRLALEHLASG